MERRWSSAWIARYTWYLLTWKAWLPPIRTTVYLRWQLVQTWRLTRATAPVMYSGPKTASGGAVVIQVPYNNLRADVVAVFPG